MSWTLPEPSHAWNDGGLDLSSLAWPVVAWFRLSLGSGGRTDSQSFWSRLKPAR
jgi:hypothetical protein